MAQPRAGGQIDPIPGKGIAMPGNRRAAEIQGQALGIAHQFDAIGIEQFLGIGQGLTQGRHLRLGDHQGLGHGTDRRGRRQRFITLQVDHDAGIRPAAQAGTFGQTVGAGSMLGRGHAGGDTQRFDGGGNALVIGGYHHFAGTSFQGPSRHLHDHRLATDQAQGLARQPGRTITGGNGHDEFSSGRISNQVHGLGSCRACKRATSSGKKVAGR